MDTLRIRQAQSRDIEKLVSLLMQLFAIEADFDIDVQKQRDGLHLLIRNQKSVVLVAEMQSEIVGMCTMQVLISTAEGAWVGLVEDMIVHEQLRGQGIGTRLLKEMEQTAHMLGLSRIQLLADKENRSALHFYRSNEWQETKLVCFRKKDLQSLIV